MKMMNMKIALSVAAMLIVTMLGNAATPIPAVLPKPDGKPGTQKKPVKVYILAGQSNMVGFGRLSGGSPLYSWIYLSPDPSVMPRNLGKGKGAILPMRVYQEAKGDELGATTESGEVVMLGTVSEEIPGGGQTVKGFIEVPMSGMHEVHVGMGDSSYAVASVNGKEVYRKDVGGPSTGSGQAKITPVQLDAGERHPVEITYMKGGSAAFWMKLVDLESAGDLETLMSEGKYTWYRDDDGTWTVRNDVIYWDVRTSKEEIGSGGPLSATSNGTFIGPEVPFGFLMGEFHDEQVLLIESSMGNRALNFDFRPPSSGKTDEEKENKYCGLEYDLMVEGAHKALENVDKIIPDYQGQGYEIAGFVWFQGHKDSGQTKEQYEGHLVNLINDLRKEFKSPDMKAAVATVAFGGWDLGEGWQGVHAAQMAVGDPEQHPEFKGTVASVDTRGFWRSRVESPTGTSYHYNHNAETYQLVGDSLGRAMVELLGGKAEPTPGNRPKPEGESKAIEDMSLAELADLVHSDAFASEYTDSEEEPTVEDNTAMGQALLPIVLDDMIGSYLASVKPARKGHMSLPTVLNGGGPGCNPGDGTLKCEYDEVLARYDIASIDDYDWKALDAIPMDAKWNYISFDPPEKQALDQSKRNREITPPKGSEEWITAGFNAKKAGWKTGAAPFGSKDGKKIPIMPNCKNPRCGCGNVPNTMWDKEAILIQQTFDVPKLKDGHIYRLVLGGGHHDRKGEGYDIYVNGKLFATAQGGYFRHNNGARGGYITPEFMDEFKSGKVTIAVKAFLRYTHFNNGTTYFAKGDPDYYGGPVPPNGNISLFMEEAKLPGPVLELIQDKTE